MPSRQIDRRSESLAATCGEILAEQAAALARIAGVLEGCIARLHELRQSFEGDGDERPEELLTVYAETRRRAELYLWYLRVQRESVGFTDDRVLDESYTIPGPLRG